MPSILPPVFHPIMVHAPLILLPLGLLVAIFRKRIPGAEAIGRWLLLFAVISLLATTLSGFLERDSAIEEWEGTEKAEWITIHTILGFATLGATLVVGGAAWIWKKRFLASANWGWVTGLVTLSLLVASTGWYGGAIVWDKLPDVEYDTGGFGQTSTSSSPGSTSSSAGQTSTTSSSTSSSSSVSSSSTSSSAGTSAACNDSAGGFTGSKLNEVGDSGLPVWEVWVRTDEPMSYDPSTIRVPKNCEVRLHYGNFDPARKAHDLVIGEGGSIATIPKLNGGGTYTINFPVRDQMSIAFYCSVGNHRAQGMEGTFVVA